MPKKASYEQIKKSFRQLAHAYHPDKNPGNKIVSAYFLEIQEAYQILSSPASRSVYDRERSILGGSKSSDVLITTQYLVQEVERLINQIKSTNIFQVNQRVLAAYLEFLLSENNIAVLLKESEHELIFGLIDNILKLSRYLSFSRYGHLEKQLKLLANKDKALLGLLVHYHKRRRREHLIQIITPWLVVLLTLLVCIAMYLY